MLSGHVRTFQPKIIIDFDGIWNMEARKIQLIGSSSYMISLPKRWIMANNLKQGDEVLIHAQGDRVIVIPKRTEKNKLVRIVMRKIPKSDEDFLRRYVYAIYMLGFDEVLIEDVEISPSMITKFTEITQKLTGMEIIDVSPTQLVFRILVTPELDIETVLKRMVQMVNSMFEGTITFLLGEDNLEELLMAEESVDRFYWLAVRLENRITRESTSWSEIRFVLGSRMVAKMVEDIADRLVVFVNYVKKSSKRDESIANLLEEIRELFKSTFEAFVNRNLERSDELIKKTEEMQREILKMINGSGDTKIALALHTLLEITEEIKSIGEIAINRAVREMAENFQSVS